VASKKKKNKQLIFKLNHRKIKILIDRILIFRFIKNLHSRFWGVASVIIMFSGLIVCFLIRPNLFAISTAFSDFGKDIRTAPYFAGTMFFASYGLWRWRNYLSHTLKRSRPLLGLVTITIIGLYLVALMPVSWKPWPYRIHFLGVVLVGLSMLATVVVDSLLTKSKQDEHHDTWRMLRLLSCVLIISGGWLTFQSSQLINHFHVALIGETMMLMGYALWVGLKTYLGEGARSNLSRLLKTFVLID